MKTDVRNQEVLAARVATQLQTDPFSALGKATTRITELLTELEKAKKDPIALRRAKLTAELKASVHGMMEYIEAGILLNTKGEGGGFQKDPSGIFSGTSIWHSENMRKRYSYCNAVTDAAKEYIDSKQVQPDAPEGENVSPTSAAMLLDTEDKQVTVKFNDGSEAIIDRETNEIGTVDKKTGTVTWFHSSWDLGKDWLKFVISYILAAGGVLWNWVSDKAYAGWNKVFGDDEETKPVTT
jgi:hypothetical protein